MRLILIFALLWNFSALASDGFTAHGLDVEKCGDYLAARQKEDNRFDTVAAAQFSDWAHGFISGYNSATTGQQVRAEISRTTIVAYLDKYCRDNPLSSIVAGVMCLRSTYAGPKLKYCK